MRPEDAKAILHACETGTLLPGPLSADPAFDLNAAYAVSAELVRMRRAQGHRTVGLKVGFANKAVWRALKLETLVWAPVYDDTVHHAEENHADLSRAGRIAPRLEPEIVFRIAGPVAPGGDAAAALSAVDGIALGYEIIDCPFPDWKFQPADMVAASGFHVALVVGQWQDPSSLLSARGAPPPLAHAPALEDSLSSRGPRAPFVSDLAGLADALATFTVTLSRNGDIVTEGSGKNVLRSPALCLAELASAIARRPGAEPLAAGDVVTTGSLTAPQPIAAGEEWRAEVSGLDLPALTLRFTS